MNDLEKYSGKNSKGLIHKWHHYFIKDLLIPGGIKIAEGLTRSFYIITQQ